MLQIINKLTVILLLLGTLLFPSFVFAQTKPLPATNTINLFVNLSSYDVSPNYIYSGVIGSFISSAYPQYTNGIWSWSNSGSGLQGDFENHEGALLLPLLNATDTNIIAWNIWMTGGDNGGYVSNQVVQWTTNGAKGPQQVWNKNLGALTNEPIPLPLMTWIPKGGPPSGTVNGGVGSVDIRNNASTNLANSFGVVQLDCWHNLMTNGVSTCLATNATANLFGFFTGNHPYPAGYLCMALQDLIDLGYETNIWSCTLDFNAGTVSASNHIAFTGVSHNGNTLSGTFRQDRQAGAWKTGSSTNGCDDAFTIMPYLADRFKTILQVTNLPAGNYQLMIDGTNECILSSAQLLVGWNSFTYTNSNGVLWPLRWNTWVAKANLEGVDPNTLSPTHNASGPGFGGNRDTINYYSGGQSYPTITGSAYISAMATTVSGMMTLGTLMHDAAQQTAHTFSLSLISSYQPAPFR